MITPKSVREAPPPPQQVVVKVEQPKYEGRSLSATLRELSTAITAPPPILPTPRPTVVTVPVAVQASIDPPKETVVKSEEKETTKKTVIQNNTSSTVGMGDKYQDLMEMMMMQSYQMQQMVMQQALLGAVTSGGSCGGQPAATCFPVQAPMGRPAIVQVAGRKGHRSKFSNKQRVPNWYQ